MGLATNIVGMHYRYPDYYEVEREKIREYAVAVQNDDASYFEEDAAADPTGVSPSTRTARSPAVVSR